MRYHIAVGVFAPEYITIRASSDAEAYSRARQCMDRRYERLDREPPVGWDLKIVRRFDKFLREGII